MQHMERQMSGYKRVAAVYSAYQSSIFPGCQVYRNLGSISVSYRLAFYSPFGTLDTPSEFGLFHTFSMWIVVSVRFLDNFHFLR